VVVIGGCNADVVASADPLPAGVSTPGRVRVGPGGAARNVAENLLRLGVPTRLVAGVGSDPLSDQVVAATARSGVDVSGVVPTDVRPNAYVAVVSGGRVLYAVSQMTASEALGPEHVRAHAAAVRASRCIVADANLAPATLEAAVSLPRRGALCLLAVSPAKAGRLAAHLSRADLLVCSAREAAVLGGQVVSTVEQARQAASVLRAQGPSVVVVTLADAGLVWAGQAVHHAPAPPVTVVDPSGAGDAVAAVVVYAALAGIPEQEAAALAAAAGAMTVTVEGSTHPQLSLAALRAYAGQAASA
jgi:pseudouridine kinase